MPSARNVVAVVGATGAVGSALARRLVARGKTPWLIGRSMSKLQELAVQLGGDHEALCSEVDLQDTAAIASALGEIPAEVSGLAYCAGDIALKPLKRATAADFRNCFDLHVVGAAETLKCLEPNMKKNPGSSVVLFSSVAVQQGFANHAIISSAKGAIEGLTRALAAELSPKIRVNAIAPSLSHSAMAKPMLSNEKMAAQIGSTHPMKRVGDPEDSAALADFLLSADASWMTGQIIGVDGGRSAVA